MEKCHVKVAELKVGCSVKFLQPCNSRLFLASNSKSYCSELQECLLIEKGRKWLNLASSVSLMCLFIVLKFFMLKITLYWADVV